MSNKNSTIQIRPQDCVPLRAEHVAELLRIPGDVRGIAIKPNWDYIAAMQGKHAIGKLEERMRALDIPLSYHTIVPMKFYPIGYDVIGMALMEDELHMDAEDFFQMGMFGVKSSLLLKILLKYFISSELTIAQAPNVWRKHYTVGNLSAAEASDKERRVALRLTEFSMYRKHLCHNLRGYFSGIWKMVVNRDVAVTERSCELEGSSFHEFIIQW